MPLCRPPCECETTDVARTTRQRASCRQWFLIAAGLWAVAPVAACTLPSPGEVGGAGGRATSSTSASTTSSASSTSSSSSSSSASSSSSSSPSSSSSSTSSSASASSAFLIGADLSWVQQDEDEGFLFIDTDGQAKDILTLLAGHGFNHVRLRTFVDPKAADGYSADGYCDLAHTVAMAKRIKAAGMGLLLDLHYSDNWADPGKQCIPVAWQADTLSAMAVHVHDYTVAVLSELQRASALPDMVQIGNEISPGMLIHICDSTGSPLKVNPVNGSISNWPNLATLLKAGVNAVKEVDPSIQIMLHIDRGGSADDSTGWIQRALSNNVPFDVFGESCYVPYQGEPSVWQSTFTTLATRFPGIKLAIAEYANLVDPSPTSTELTAANEMLFDLPNNQGIGTFFWEPTHSGAWGRGLFTTTGQFFIADPIAMAAYDQMKVTFRSRL